MPPIAPTSAALPALAPFVKFRRPATLKIGLFAARLRMPAPASVSAYGAPMLNVYGGAPVSNNSVPTVATVLKLTVVARAAPNSATELIPEGGWPVAQFDASVQSLELAVH